MSDYNMVQLLERSLQGKTEDERAFILKQVDEAQPKLVEAIIKKAEEEIQSSQFKMLYASYQQELEHIPQGNVRLLHDLKSKYRRMGLDIW